MNDKKWDPLNQVQILRTYKLTEVCVLKPTSFNYYEKPTLKL